MLPANLWDRSHFILSVDPLRVVTVPETLNADTGLVCILVGGVEDLERRSIHELLNHSSPTSYVWDTDFTVALSPIGR